MSPQQQMQLAQGLGQVGQLRVALASALAKCTCGLVLHGTRRGSLGRPLLIDQK
jgi:hypothetical protein